MLVFGLVVAFRELYDSTSYEWSASATVRKQRQTSNGQQALLDLFAESLGQQLACQATG